MLVHTETLRTIHNRLTHVAVLEEDRSLDVVPLLAGEGIDSALLVTLALRELLVLANRCRLVLCRA